MIHSALLHVLPVGYIRPVCVSVVCNDLCVCVLTLALSLSPRCLRDGELFEIVIQKMVDRWSGSIEAGKIKAGKVFPFFSPPLPTRHDKYTLIPTDRKSVV